MFVKCSVEGGGEGDDEEEEEEANRSGTRGVGDTVARVAVLVRLTAAFILSMVA